MSLGRAGNIPSPLQPPTLVSTNPFHRQTFRRELPLRLRVPVDTPIKRPAVVKLAPSAAAAMVIGEVRGRMEGVCSEEAVVMVGLCVGLRVYVFPAWRPCMKRVRGGRGAVGISPRFVAALAWVEEARGGAIASISGGCVRGFCLAEPGREGRFVSKRTRAKKGEKKRDNSSLMQHYSRVRFFIEN